MKRKKLDKNQKPIKDIEEICEDSVVKMCLNQGLKVWWLEKDPDRDNTFEVTMINPRNYKK